ncbi:MAG TPA: hypothetical protein VKV34_05205 [Thermoleophilia bacterium]|nr:hypothetical protein [Thermoleophilia bacterium]
MAVDENSAFSHGAAVPETKSVAVEAFSPPVSRSLFDADLDRIATAVRSFDFVGDPE